MKPTLKTLVLPFLLLIAGTANSALTGFRDTDFELEAQPSQISPFSLDASAYSPDEQLNNLRRVIPGEPEIDYPIFRSAPETSFTCGGRAIGYYADVEARCQVFRVCANTELSGKGFAFLCPNGTLFNQKFFVCDWYRNVDCSGSTNFYAKNVEMRLEINSVPNMMAIVKEMVAFPMKHQAPIDLESTPLPVAEITNNGPIQTSTVIPNLFENLPMPPPQRQQQQQHHNHHHHHHQQQQQQPQPPHHHQIGPQTNHLNGRIPNGNVVLRPHPNTVNPQTGKAYGLRVTTKEGDFQVNTKVQNDSDSEISNQLLRAKPIYISNLGELSTDLGDRFDINRVRLVAHAPNGQNGAPNKAAIHSDEKSVPITTTPTSPVTFDNSQSDEAVPTITTTFEPSAQYDGIVSPSPNHPNQGNLASSHGHNDVSHTGANLLNHLLLDKSKPAEQVRTDAVHSGENDLLQQLLRSRQASAQHTSNSPANQNDLLQQLLQQKQQQQQQQRPQIQKPNGQLNGNGHAEVSHNRNNGQQISDFNSGAGHPGSQQNYGQTFNAFAGGNGAPHQNSGQRLNNGFGQNTLNHQQPSAASHPNNGQGPNRFNGNNAFTQQPFDQNTFPQSTFEPNDQQQPTQPSLVNTDQGFPGFTNQPQNQNEFVPTQQSITIGNGNNFRQNQGSNGFSSPVQNNGLPNTVVNSEEVNSLQSSENFGSGPSNGVTTSPGFPQQTFNQNTEQPRDSFASNGVRSGQNEGSGSNGFTGDNGFTQQPFNQQPNENSQGPSSFPGQNIFTEEILDPTVEHNEIPSDQQFNGFTPNVGDENSVQSTPQYQDDTTVHSGDGDLLQHTLNNQNNGQSSGDIENTLSDADKARETELLQSIQLILRHRKATLTITETEILLQIIREMTQRRQTAGLNVIPVASGERDLLETVHEILRDEGIPAPAQELQTPIFSGEMDSLLQLVNNALAQQKGQAPSVVSVESGEANLLEYLQNVLRRRYKETSGEGDLLQHTIGQGNKPALHPVSSGEGNTLQQTPQQNGKQDQFTHIPIIEVHSPHEQPIQSGDADSLNHLHGNQQHVIAIESGEGDLLQSIQLLLDHRKATSPSFYGESDLLLQIIRDILHRRRVSVSQLLSVKTSKSDLLLIVHQMIKEELGDEVLQHHLAHPVYSGEAHLLQHIVHDALEKEKHLLPGVDAIESGEADLLEYLEIVVDHHVNFYVPYEPPTTTTNPTTAVGSGEGDLLQSLRHNEAPRTEQNQFQPIPTTHETPVQQIESGEGDSLNHLNGNQQNFNGNQQNFNGNQQYLIAVESGEADLLDSIQLILNHRKATAPAYYGESDLLLQIIREIIQRRRTTGSQFLSVQSGESDLLQIVHQIVREELGDDAVKQHAGTPVFSGEADLLQHIIRDALQKRKNLPQGLIAVESGEADLLEYLQIVVDRRAINGNQQKPVHSGSGDLLQQTVTQQNGQQKPVHSRSGDLQQQTVTQLNGQQNNGVPVQSGEGDSLQSLHQTPNGVSPTPTTRTTVQNVQPTQNDPTEKYNHPNLIPVESGEADLLQSIQLILKHRKTVSPVYYGESDLLLQIIREVIQRRHITGTQFLSVHSGESDLLEVVHQILREEFGNDSITQHLGTPIYSGEADLLQHIIREALHKQKNLHPDVVAVESGEADLLEYLQIVLNRRVDNGSQQKAIHSGSGDLLQQTVTQPTGQQNNGIRVTTVHSGEGDLLQQNQYQTQQPQTQTPKYTESTTPTAPSTPIFQQTQSGEGNSLTHSNGNQQHLIPVESGEADLLQSIQLILNHRKGTTAVYYGESDLLLQIIREIIQRRRITGTQFISVQSGQSDLLEVVHQLVREEVGNVTPTPIQSGESDLLLQIVNEAVQKQKGVIAIESGEADLLEFLQIILRRRVDNGNGLRTTQISGTESPVQSAPQIPPTSTIVSSGDGNLLQSTVTHRQPAQQIYQPQQQYNQRPQQFYQPQLQHQYQPQPQSQTRPLFQPQPPQQFQPQPPQRFQPQQFQPQPQQQFYSQQQQRFQPQLQFQPQSQQQFQQHPQQQFHPQSPQQFPRQHLTYGPVPNYNVPTPVAPTVASPVQHVQPAQPAQPVQHVQPAQPVQHVQSVQPVQPVPPVQSVQQLPATSQFRPFNSVFPGQNAVYSVEQKQNHQSTNQLTQTDRNQYNKVYSDDRNTYTQTTYTQRLRSQSTSIDTQNYHYKITETRPFEIPLNRTTTESDRTYIPPYQSTPTYAPPPTVAPNRKQVFTYPANHPKVTQIYYYNRPDRTQQLNYDTNIQQYDYDHSRDVKDRRSTDLLLKGLFLQSFEDSQASGTINTTNYVPNETATSTTTTTTTTSDNDHNDNTPTTRDNYSRALPQESSKTPANDSTQTQTDVKHPFLIYVEAISEAHRLQMHQMAMLKQNGGAATTSEHRSAQVYYFAEIENRPHSFNLAPRPPLQEVYPKSIQNIVADTPFDNQVVHSKLAAPFTPPVPIPSSLPSIVHDPESAAQHIQTSFRLPPISRPVITASLSNHQEETSDTQEKIIVKVVKAPGWYLNDDSERTSYFNAVRHGLLGRNGLVYVNNVQKVPNIQQPFEYSSSLSSSALPPQFPSSQDAPAITSYSPNSLIPSNSVGTNFWGPCGTYSHFLKKRNDFGRSFDSVRKLVDATSNSQSKQPPVLSPPPQLATLNLETNSDALAFDGQKTSYDVQAASVGRLSSDNSPVQYNLGFLLSSLAKTR